MKLSDEARAFFVKAGSRGGKATLKKLGKKHFKKIRALPRGGEKLSTDHKKTQQT